MSRRWRHGGARLPQNRHFPPDSPKAQNNFSSLALPSKPPFVKLHKAYRAPKNCPHFHHLPPFFEGATKGRQIFAYI